MQREKPYNLRSKAYCNCFEEKKGKFYMISFYNAPGQ